MKIAKKLYLKKMFTPVKKYYMEKSINSLYMYLKNN